MNLPRVMIRWIARHQIAEEREKAQDDTRVNIADRLRLAGYPEVAHAVHSERPIPPRQDQPMPKINRQTGLKW